MTNIVLLVKDRPRLTSQCLKTLYENTPNDQFNLLVMNDGSMVPTVDELGGYVDHDNFRCITMNRSIGIVGWLRNVGASASERYFGRGEWICFIDNDIAFLPNWLPKMIAVMQHESNPIVLGGYRHPFHGPQLDIEAGRFGWQSTDAVAGYMHFMTWDTWDKYGPYDQHAKGVCQSEDFAFCQKIIADGGKVGYIHPPVILNCGVTNSEGKPAVGSESFLRVPNYVYE